MPDRHPWRAVTAVEGPRSGRGSTLGPDTWRRTAWWVLTLACGHVVERTVRYWPRKDWPPQHGGSQSRSLADVKPAPRRVRCDYCPPLTEPETL
jgi:hypothetical protein